MLHLLNPSLHLQEDCCAYSCGVDWLHANGINSLRTHCRTYRAVPKTPFHLQGCLYRWYINKLYYSCTYNCLPEDEPLCSKHAEDIVKI